MPADMTAKLPHFKKIMEAHNADRTLSQMIIETAKASDGTIKRYCENPQENERLTQAHRNANIYARTRPNMLYNAMLHPLIPMACRGMVYYQGEANTKRYADMVQYRTTQRLWLERLREEWNRPEFHLLSVMLPGFGRTLKSGPGWGDLEAVNAHSWAVMRDSQLGILDLPATGVANTVDLGDEKNIHPGDKLPIAERLVLLARRDTLGETALLASGPMLESVSVKGSEVTIRFTNATGLRTVDGEAPRAFWASEDGKEWHSAAARIVAETVVLSVPAGVQPGQVRYAYAAMPKVNLVNEAGLPAYPFSFDVEN
jgi:sialate O-acetylesterase